MIMPVGCLLSVSMVLMLSGLAVAQLSGLFVEEPSEAGRETLGLLDLGQVPAVGHEFEGAISQPGDRLVCLGGGEHPVSLSPHHERGRL